MNLKSLQSKDKKEPVSKEPITTTSSDIKVESAGQITPSHHANIKEKRVIMTMLIKDEVTKADIIWCLYQVLSHSSQRIVDKPWISFRTLKSQRTKIARTACSDCDFVTIGLDESLNKVTQKR